MFRFPWGDMHSLNLGWFLQKFNELREDWATAEAGIDGALDAEIQKAEDALSDVFDARDAAAASATAAAGSASAANTSKTAAQNSATAAASSATLANQKATAAGLSEAAAAQSATAASNSASAAATSATQAGQSATNAAGSATTAGQEATNAAGSATAAANSATAAAASETAAAASAAAAEAVEESIPVDYSTLSTAVKNLFYFTPYPIAPLSFCTGEIHGLNAYGNIIKGVLPDNDKNIGFSGNSPNVTTFAQQSEDNYSIYLPAGTYYINVIMGYEDYGGSEKVQSFTIADKTTRTATVINFSNNFCAPYKKLKAQFTITAADFYSAKFYFPVAGKFNFQWYITNE